MAASIRAYCDGMPRLESEEGCTCRMPAWEYTGSSLPLLSMLRESAECRCPQRDMGPHACALLPAL